MTIEHHRRSLRNRGSTKMSSAVFSIDTLAYIVSFLSLAFTLDQIRIIWIDRDAEGVSLLSWSFYTLSAFVWLCYGLIHKERVIIITNFLWVAFSLVIVIGVLMY